jgi:hypothetical protein
MADWKTTAHLEDHFDLHGRELRCRSLEDLDRSAQETIRLGVKLTYRDRITNLRRIGYFHRESARFVCTDTDGFILSHFRTDEAYVAELPYSTYTDDEV